MIKLTPELTPASIITEYTQERIMEYYLGITLTNKLFCSPLRKDNNPTCMFKYNHKGKLRMIDFAGYFVGDCLDVAAFRMGLVLPKDLNKVLDNIVKDMSSTYSLSEPNTRKINRIKQSSTSAKIDVQIRMKNNKPFYSKVDKEYWYDNFGISLPTLKKYNVYPVQRVWINKILKTNLSYKADDPTYGYLIQHEGNTYWKIYKPLTKEKINKWRGNAPRNAIQGIVDHSKPSLLTKSLKDIMVLYELGIENTYAYGAESIIDCLPNTEYILLDNDMPGKRATVKIKNKFNVTPLLIPKHLSKDVSDLVKEYGFNYVKKLMNYELKKCNPNLHIRN